MRVPGSNPGGPTCAPVVQWLRYGLAKAVTRVRIPAGAFQFHYSELLLSRKIKEASIKKDTLDTFLYTNNQKRRIVQMQEKIFDLLFKEDEISWQTIIFEAVRTEQMDPWDIDIAQLSQRFLEMIKQLKEMDFRISGKIILAAAILLRLKSTKLVGEDMSQLDRLIAMSENGAEDAFYGDLEDGYEADGVKQRERPDDLTLIPRTPQPRKRKVSVYDLVEALQKALDVKKRRHFVRDEIHVEIPKKSWDIEESIDRIHQEIMAYLGKKEKLGFKELIKGESKEEKIYTFIPLLHLGNQQKITLLQETHLSEIEIVLPKIKRGEKNDAHPNAESGQ